MSSHDEAEECPEFPQGLCLSDYYRRLLPECVILQNLLTGKPQQPSEGNQQNRQARETHTLYLHLPWYTLYIQYILIKSSTLLVNCFFLQHFFNISVSFILFPGWFFSENGSKVKGFVLSLLINHSNKYYISSSPLSCLLFLLFQHQCISAMDSWGHYSSLQSNNRFTCTENSKAKKT